MCFWDKSTVHPPCLLQKERPPPSVWARWEYYWTLIWKKSLLICFEGYHCVPYYHRQSEKRMVNALLLHWLTLPPSVRASLEDKSIVTTKTANHPKPSATTHRKLFAATEPTLNQLETTRTSPKLFAATKPTLNQLETTRTSPKQYITM